MITATALALLLAAADERPTLAVLGFDSKGATKLEVDASSTAVAKGLRDLDAFDVRTSEDVAQMLTLERQKQLMGQTSDLSALNLTLGVRYVVAGAVGHVGAELTLDLKLLDTQDGKVLGQKHAAAPALDKLVVAAQGSVQELMGPLLANELGMLLVRTREEGAEVLVDDISRASTPLVAPIKLPRGRHRLVVKKDGFIARVTSVTIQKEQLSVEDVVLMPSADYVSAYQSRNKRLRLGAYIASGVAVASFATALLLDRAVAEPKFQNEFVPRRNVLEAISRTPTLTPESFTNAKEYACAQDLAACRTQANAVQGQLSAVQISSIVLVGLGVVAAGAAGYFWFWGDDPGRYTQLIAGLSADGGSIGLAGRF